AVKIVDFTGSTEYGAWLDCTRLGIATPAPTGEPGVASDLAGPAKMFLDHARVALSSGHVFGTGGAGFVRLNFATSPAILTEAVTRMGEAVGSIARTERQVPVQPVIATEAP
ncbi:hypothetical protein ACFQZ8_18920, partial [Micromonospora azadirachtae]